MTDHTASGPSTPPPVFTRDDLKRVAAADSLIGAFKAFLLDRFALYTQTTRAVDTRGRAVDPVIDAHARDCGGFGFWQVGGDWLKLAHEKADEVTIVHHLSDDRGPATYREVKMPADVIFGGVPTGALYAEYLRLKALFEPGAP